uniref:Glutamate racemase n=1 Tax=uncultured Bacteroidota bacterium TaxID=152509 RepID=H5SGH9_9BACT|nr:glutamate racemase [uncultured Bacteroidetes bacterium]
MKVGVFDSGLGGLLTARRIRELAPSVDILYYGDTAHLPYGDKSPAQIEGYVREIGCFLREMGAQALVVACNTASAVGLRALSEVSGDLPIYDAITPALEAFSHRSYPEPVGVLGTYTTIRSGVYGRALRELGYEVREVPAPLLVPLIEEGWTDHPAMRAVLETYLGAVGPVGTLLLACTHYPVLTDLIRDLYTQQGQKVEVVSTAELLARRVVESLPLQGEGSLSLWVSDLSPRFEEVASRFWGEPLRLEVVRPSVIS